MLKVSLEYCHVTPGTDYKKVIRLANKWVPNFLKVFKGTKIQKIIMVDDIHASAPADERFIKQLLSKLAIKPDCIFLESDFTAAAAKLVKHIDLTQRDLITSDERVFIRENIEYVRSTTEFLLSWKKKHGGTHFSCPTLATASYLCRLGLIRPFPKPIWGARLMAASYAINVLTSELMSVEDKVQSLVEATYPKALRKIGWFLF